MGKAVGLGAASGLIITAIVLSCAMVYSFWIAPEGGDSWDAAYFFTHGAFLVLFTVGFAPGFALKLRGRRSIAPTSPSPPTNK